MDNEGGGGGITREGGMQELFKVFFQIGFQVKSFSFFWAMNG